MKDYGLKLKEKWNTFSPREKNTLSIGACIIGFLLLYAFVWSPYLDKINELRASVRSNQALLAWMRVTDQKLNGLHGPNLNYIQLKTPIALMSFLQKEINRRNLSPALKQLKQAANDGIQIQFQKIEFDKAIQFIIEVLKESNVNIAELAVNATEATGMVDLNVVLSLKAVA